MDNVVNVPTCRADTSGSAAPEPSGPGDPAAANRKRFKLALDPIRELNESQSPETRRAVLATLDGLQQASGTSQPEASPGPVRPAEVDALTQPRSRRQSRHAASGRSPTAPQQPNPVQSPGPRPGTVESENRIPAETTGPNPLQTGTKQAASGHSSTGQTAADRQASTTVPDNTGASGDNPGSSPQQTGSKPPASIPGGTGKPGNAPDRPDATGDSPEQLQQRSGARRSSSGTSHPTHAEQGRSNTPSPHTDNSGASPVNPASVDPSPPSEISNTAGPDEPPESARSKGTEASPVPAARSAGFAQQVGEVVDRILVSIPNSRSGDEVRIQLKSSILDGSEIRIFRDGGEVNIVFLPKSESAREFLSGQESRFQSILADRLHDDRIRVEVEPVNRGKTFAEENEGRSRQRYTAEDDGSSHGSPQQGATR